MELMTHYWMEVLATVALKEEEDIVGNQDIQAQRAGERLVIMVMAGMRSMDTGGSLGIEDILLPVRHYCIWPPTSLCACGKPMH